MDLRKKKVKMGTDRTIKVAAADAGPGERIPLTIVDSDAEKGTITIIFQIVGKTTAMMVELNIGDIFQDAQGH
jgi:NAD(P)H-flavin reductase